jgi:hypothetical protein
MSDPTTAEDALNEIERINERLRLLDEQVRHAMSNPTSQAVPQLQQEISDAMARKQWLFEQIQRLQKAGGQASPHDGLR